MRTWIGLTESCEPSSSVALASEGRVLLGGGYGSSDGHWIASLLLVCCKCRVIEIGVGDLKLEPDAASC